MAPARQQKVGRVCLGEAWLAQKGPAVLPGSLGLGVLLMRGSVVTWGSEQSLSKQLGLGQGAASL